jgi:GntR family transcriptional repressor for pyruvate dehydrogenase complex
MVKIVSQKDASSGNLSDFVREHLINYIRVNHLKSGDTVPSEVRVSVDLGISRGIVREAYRGLKMAGILEISNGRAPRVGRISDGGIAHVLQHALSTEQATIEQVLDLRAAIEIRAAELAASYRTPRDVAALREKVAIMAASRQEQNRFIEADTQFHEVLGRATGNPLFGMIAVAIRESLMASIRAGLQNRTTTQQLDQVLKTHEGIAEAISDQDPVRARSYMTIHFEEAIRSFGLKPLRDAAHETLFRYTT